ncbi:hypothetical protein ACFFHM_01790 [Halalkalibacter kiskunsagensis]|uniref:DUF4367 domain-containing protein n=1 Tax=Halalkalibacter kiskunsagensis TaxID=1548599 RepID=A0ABV6K8M7_9BACI
MKHVTLWLFSFVVIAAIMLTGCGEGATVEKVEGDNQTASETESETKPNWLEEKETLTAEEQMIKTFVSDFYSSDPEAREQAIIEYVHPDVQEFFLFVSGFTDDTTTIDLEKFAVIETVEHEEDGETGMITLTRTEDESGKLHEKIFFVYEEKLGWIFSPTSEDAEMREVFDEMRALLSAEVPPADQLVTYEEEEEIEEESSSADSEKEVGTRNNPLTIGERVSLTYYDLFHGNVQLDIELLEVISGDAAWEMVRQGNQFNDEPGEGQEYILAKYHVVVNEVEEEPFDLNHSLFDAVSSGGNTYDQFISVSGLEPDLWNELYEGAEREGYTYFLVDQDDENPLAAFQRKSDAEVWFQLRAE